MTVSEVCALLGAKKINLPDADRKVESGYAGDFLSFVMGKAPTDSVWFTVMNNVNVCAVATLADVSVVVLCEGVAPDEQLFARIKQQKVNLIVTELDIYAAIKRICDKI